ncbi:type III PLP-dependent enzyme domain-containing protein [Pseudonocardia phyllosphaerae]|uniref:amino acid deaminase n=1 Tax=Pseudonocardia phyllosphaerae TaxID=3390502 RepID=UPI00397DB8ED
MADPMTPRRITLQDKSFPASAVGRDITGLRLPLAEFSTPLFVIDGPALAHNLATFAAWTARRGLELMPHGKTTMAPVLWRRQLDAGATGITVATGWQADVALRAGVPTVQLANMCTDPRLLRRLAAHLVEHPEQELVCWADSVAVVDRMEQALPGDARLGVLVELGAEGARGGARTEHDAVAVAERVAASPVLALHGVAGYEGPLAHDRSPDAVGAVRAWCDRLAALVERVRPLVGGTPWISAGGSAFFEIVAESLAQVPDVRAILRSGAYLVHDSGFYSSVSPLDGSRLAPGEEPLRPAMFTLARVVSQPEPGLALLDAGKRDVPFDEGLPVPLTVADDLGGAERPITAEITALNDQHAYLRWAGPAPVAVGDVVRLGLSHPCTAFDKWRLVPVVDADGAVTEAVETFF